MIITISGVAGAGKSVIAKSISKEFNLKHYSSGDLMRQIALEKNMSLEELSMIAEKSFEIDQLLDDRQKELGKKEDDFIIDGRLSAYFIPHAVKIFLKCDLKIRAERILSAKRSTEQFESLDEAINKIELRENSEVTRYTKWYQFNPYNEGEYDIVFDTSHLNEQQVKEQLIIKIRNEFEPAK